MGPESTVTHRESVPSDSTKTSVTCDQAIFSSVRTPMGQGYQIVAASKGLTPGEKREINQHSPSHGGLCQDGPDAKGVAWYPLSSGRLALAHSADAGAEHSGRGARRTWTTGRSSSGGRSQPRGPDACC